MPLTLKSTGGGSVTLDVPSTASTYTLTFPAATAELISSSSAAFNIGSGQIYKDASGNVGIGTTSPTSKLDCLGTLSVSENSGSANAGGQINFNARNDASAILPVSYIKGALSNGSVSGYSGGIVFGTAQNNTYGERARLDSNGNLLLGKTTDNLDARGVQISGNTTANQQYWTGTNDLTRTVVGAGLGTGGSYASHLYYFNTSSNLVGYIAHTNTGTSYNTSSDYRLKENVKPMQNALATVAQLNPVTYTWKIDGSNGQGFIAHELQAVLPDAVTGEKDEVDADGKPKYQGVDTSFLVATLTKAIQELSEKLDAANARIAALEAK